MAHHKRAVRELGAWLCFEDEAGQALRPPKARTWSRCGKTPIVPVCGKGSGRVSLAGLVCAKSGERPRLIYRALVRHGRRGERRLGPVEYAALLDAAHQQLRGKIVLVWDNDRLHTCTTMAALIEARSSWLTVFRLPAYAPELNPTEGVWAHLKRGLGNLAPHGTKQLAALVKTRLKRMQYRRDLIDSFITQTGLVLEPP